MSRPMIPAPPPFEPRIAVKPRRWRGVLRRAGEGLMALLLVLSVLVIIDFARYIALIAPREPSVPPVADGAVALTGGAERITDALDLLAEQKVRRVLISGVNAATSAESLGASAPRYEPLFDCCIDIDRNALNTLGNALESVRWARQNHFESLLVVTSSYHMPRALLELRRLAPDLRLLPYPVVTAALQVDHWWGDPETARVLIGEYVKYTIARVQLRLHRPTADAPDPIAKEAKDG